MDTYIKNDPTNPINTKEKDFVNICDDCGSEKEYNKERQNDICNTCDKCFLCNDLKENCECLPF